MAISGTHNAVRDALARHFDLEVQETLRSPKAARIERERNQGNQ
jgi:hypothetical protein